MEDHGGRMTMNFRLKILYVVINIVYLELPLNVPVNTNLCFSHRYSTIGTSMQRPIGILC